MGTDKKPQISILMAVYEPRLDWLREQLESLNGQTYPNLHLYLRDDCSKTVPFEEIKALADECITAFPYTIERNTENLGSNRTFEQLTKEAEGEYFAYSDQDDVWLSEKLIKLYSLIEKENAVMAYSDMSVIDETGQQVAGSFKVIRPRIEYLSGTNLSEKYFFRNCTAGCAMVVKAEIAKKALPFPRNTIHDQWIAICAAREGRISFCEESLIQNRQHGNNQTGILTGITDKNSYSKKRLEPLRERFLLYEQYVRKYGSKDELISLEGVNEFVDARLSGKMCQIWRNRQFSPKEAKFEIAMKFMPGWLFKKVLKALR